VPTPAEILNAATGLTLDERAEVAPKLLLSLEPGDFEEGAGRARAAEIERRLHLIRSGGCARAIGITR
jgi:hypothetical protein